MIESLLGLCVSSSSSAAGVSLRQDDTHTLQLHASAKSHSLADSVTQ